MASQVVINGLLLGAMLGLVGLGFSLVWGILNIVNLAHSSFNKLGAYVTFTLFAQHNLDPFESLPERMAALFLLGYGLQK
jgi:branched-chain amino acid transport system permease protein